MNIDKLNEAMLNEGPGAGYDIISKHYKMTGSIQIDDVHSEVDKYGTTKIFVKVYADYKGTVEEVSGRSYYYGAEIFEDVPIELKGEIKCEFCGQHYKLDEHDLKEALVIKEAQLKKKN